MSNQLQGNELATVKVEAVPQQHLGQMSEGAAMVSMIERMMRDKDVDVDKLHRLLEMRERIEAQQALTVFNNAMAEAQAEMDPVRADSANPQTRSKYASYFALDQAIRPIYTKHGLMVTFDTDPVAARNDLELMVVMYISKGAFTKRYQIPMPADGMGAKGGQVMTRTHATGSAFSYGKRYLLCGAFNITVGELDDDGNAATRRAPQAAPNAMRPIPQTTSGPYPEPKPKQPVVTPAQYKELDRSLMHAAEQGTVFLTTAWKNLTPLEQHAMAAAKDRRYKPRAAEIDASQQEQQHEEDQVEDGKDELDDDIPF